MTSSFFLSFCVINFQRLLMDKKETHLGAVPLRTGQSLIGETIDVNVRAAEVAVSSPPDSTLEGWKMFYVLYIRNVCFCWLCHALHIVSKELKCSNRPLTLHLAWACRACFKALGQKCLNIFIMQYVKKVCTTLAIYLYLILSCGKTLKKSELRTRTRSRFCSLGIQ